MKSCATCGSQWPDDTKFCPNDGSTLRSASGSDLIGSVIHNTYHIVKKLGEGGMGAVYLGEHVKMGRKSAIKVMTQAMAHDHDAIARFNREAANAARINHPNVCAIYDFGETQEGLIYLAMEFIEGGSLTSLLEQERALAPQRAGKLLQQAGDALQAAHDLGIVHRDLKPDNIMIARGRDGADVVKVVDFGIAKAMSGDEGQKVTKTGLVVGTPEYMSPEQLSGDKLDGRSDIYSLALVFFNTLTGKLPFEAESSQEMMIKRLTDDPLKLNDAFPGRGFPPKLQEVMDRALARMPGDRYTSAAQFARDASLAIQGMADVAPPVADGATQMIDSAAAVQAATVAKTRLSDWTQGVAAAAPPAKAARTVAAPAPTLIPLPATRVAKKKPVVAIAAVVGVLAVGGVAASVVWSGRNTPTPAATPDSVIGANVSRDTARQVAVNNTRGSTPTAGRTPPPAPGVTQPNPSIKPPNNSGGSTTVVETPVTRPRVDSATISGQLGDLLDAVVGDDAGKRQSALRQAETIYGNSAVPASLRAEAASLVGQGNWEEQKASEACRWILSARTLAPVKSAYSRLQQLWQCPQ